MKIVMMWYVTSTMRKKKGRKSGWLPSIIWARFFIPTYLSIYLYTDRYGRIISRKTKPKLKIKSQIKRTKKANQTESINRVRVRRSFHNFPPKRGKEGASKQKKKKRTSNPASCPKNQWHPTIFSLPFLIHLPFHNLNPLPVFSTNSHSLPNIFSRKFARNM